MSSNNDSIGKTFFVVIALCLVCTFIVATAAIQLRPLQIENKLLDSQKNILAAAGLTAEDNVKELFTKHIQERFVDLDSGEFVEAPANFDYRSAMKDPALSITLSDSEDRASINSRANIAPVYLAYDKGIESGELSTIILPIHGYGLWSTMHAFLALEQDGKTVKGLNYYELAETPGLGGEVQNPKFLAQFIGKQVVDGNGEPALKVKKPGQANLQSAHEVDGLSGATITANGVQNTFDFWIGAKGFGPFLAKVRDGALNNG